MTFFYPEIEEIEIDDTPEELIFYSEVDKHDNGYLWKLRRVDYIPLERILEHAKELSRFRYITKSIDEETVKSEASDFFGEKVEWIDFNKMENNNE